MWIPKGSVLIRGRRLFEARLLLEEIRNVRTWYILYSVMPKFHDINHLPAGFCYHDNNTYLAGETYIGGNCTVNCTCFGGGIAFCRELCPFIFIICGPGEVPETYYEKVNGTCCSCPMKRCVPSKWILLFLICFVHYFCPLIDTSLELEPNEAYYVKPNIPLPPITCFNSRFSKKNIVYLKMF